MSSGFITESEVEARKQKRQEEWERVRKAEDPIECPEPEDTRSLFDRLQEQKNKADAEKAEQQKLNSMVKGLESDEVEFLDMVDKTKLEEEDIKRKEELAIIEDLKKREECDGIIAANTTTNKPTSNTHKSVDTKKTSQKSLLMNAVKRKSQTTNSGDDCKRRKDPDGSSASQGAETTGARVCGVLPGLVSYGDCPSSSNDSSSSDGSDDDDLCAVGTKSPAQLQFVDKSKCTKKEPPGMC